MPLGIAPAAERRNGQRDQLLERGSRRIARAIVDARQRGAVGLASPSFRALPGFLRTVAERVRRRGPAPVLRFSDTGSGRPVPPDVNRILVTTDFSEGTGRAMEFARAIAQGGPADRAAV